HPAVPRSSTSKAPPSPPPPAVPRPCPFPLVHRVTHIQQWSSQPKSPPPLPAQSLSPRDLCSSGASVSECYCL
ncbi:unnamed protein product, partial [Closterium sp. NIES-53]